MIYHDTKDDIYVLFKKSFQTTGVKLDPKTLDPVYKVVIYHPNKNGRIQDTLFGKTELKKRLGISMFPVTDEPTLAKLMMLGLE
jgi:hypothetical protein